MPDPRLPLLAALVVLAGLFAWRWARAAAGRGPAPLRPTPLHVAIGFGVAFLDTLGIGSLATTTATFRALRVVPDERLPATMIVGLTPTVVAQALIFIARIRIDPALLALMVAAALAGGWLGARVVARLPRRPIQRAMGGALLVAALFMTVAQLDRMPVGGTALTLDGGARWLAVGANLVLGALLMVGVGNYGPTFVLLSALGMDPRAAFPIMMGSGAFAALLGALAFVRQGAPVHRPALGLTLGGVPGVLAAAFVVTSLPLAALRWLAIGVVAWAAVGMLRAAATRPTPAGSSTPA